MIAHETVPTAFESWFFSIVDDLTPDESAWVLTRTTAANFVIFMRGRLKPEVSQTLADGQLCNLHEAMCRRLEAKVGHGNSSWESSAPAGMA